MPSIEAFGGKKASSPILRAGGNWSPVRLPAEAEGDPVALNRGRVTTIEKKICPERSLTGLETSSPLFADTGADGSGVPATVS